jgi:hypothetical protein
MQFRRVLCPTPSARPGALLVPARRSDVPGHESQSRSGHDLFAARNLRRRYLRKMNPCTVPKHDANRGAVPLSPTLSWNRFLDSCAAHCLSSHHMCFIGISLCSRADHEALAPLARALRSPTRTSFSSCASWCTERFAAICMTPSATVCFSADVISGFPSVFIIPASGSMRCSMKCLIPPAPPPTCHCKLGPMTPQRRPGPQLTVSYHSHCSSPLPARLCGSLSQLRIIS